MALQKPNPVFRSMENKHNDGVYDYNAYQQEEISESGASYKGITLKTLALLALTVLGGILSVLLLIKGNIELLMVLLVSSGLVTFISVFIGMRSERHTNVAAMIYSLFEGVTLGLLVLVVEIVYPGCALAALLATATIFFVMLLLHSSGTLRATPKLNKIILTVLVSSIIISIITGISMIFTDALYNLLFGAGPVAFLICGVMILVGAFMLLIDFSNAEAIVNNYSSTKNDEWKVSLGLMVSIIYIFYRVLRLIMLIADLADRK